MRRGRTLDAARDRALAGLSDLDRRLAYELATGVMRQQTVLDARLAPLVPRGWSAVDTHLQDVLRLGAYQLAALDRVPPHAAVATSVALAKARGGPRAGGFVNAVLRKVAALPSERHAREAESGSEVSTSRDETLAANGAGASITPRLSQDPNVSAAALAAQYSHPEWLVERWFAQYGAAGTERLLHWNNSRPRLVLQPARLEMEGLEELWRAAGIEVTPAPYGAGLIVEGSRPDELPGFGEGDFIVQDPAQALLAWYADLPPGTLVYDACAAPGGKTVTTTPHATRVIAGDKNPRRVQRLAENLRRAGTGREHAIVADARRPPLREASMPAVLLDVPCLGTGTFARNPDARWRVTREALAELEHLQAELLDGAAATTAPGGLLVYSTCSLEPEENEAQVGRFLERHPEFRREPSDTFPAALQSASGDLTIVPQRDGMDGAFAARLRRSATTA